MSLFISPDVGYPMALGVFLASQGLSFSPVKMGMMGMYTS